MTSEIWSWMLTLCLLTVLYLTGKHLRVGWLVGIGSQVLWVTYSVITRQWGFLAGAVIIGVMYVRNWILWGKDEK